MEVRAFVSGLRNDRPGACARQGGSAERRCRGHTVPLDPDETVAQRDGGEVASSSDAGRHSDRLRGAHSWDPPDATGCYARASASRALGYGGRYALDARADDA